MLLLRLIPGYRQLRCSLICCSCCIEYTIPRPTLFKREKGSVTDQVGRLELVSRAIRILRVRALEARASWGRAQGKGGGGKIRMV